MDIAIVPVGMAKPVTIGKLHADGKLQFAWPDKLTLSAADESDFAMPLWPACGIACAPEAVAVNVIPIGTLYLYQDGEQHGALYAATSPLLGNWLETPEYNAADTGCIARWVYAMDPAADSVDCQTPVEYEGKTHATYYHASVHLQPGFNLLMVQVQEVHTTNQELKAPFAARVNIHSAKELPSGMVWQVRWFFD